MKATQHKPTEGYPKLVLIIAHRILKNLPAHIERADILQEGYLGYLDAQKRFNPAVGVSFETFANIKIRGAIQDYLRSWDTLGRSARTAAKQYARAYSHLEGVLSRAPSDEEVARELQCGVEKKVVKIRLYAQTAVSLEEMSDGFLPDCSDISAHPLEILDQEEQKKQIVGAIEALPGKERLVTSLYHTDGLTMKEIGKVLGLTEARISQLHIEIVLAIRERLQRRDARALQRELPTSIRRLPPRTSLLQELLQTIVISPEMETVARTFHLIWTRVKQER